MAFEDLSTNSQDYLKVIWDLQEWDDGPVQPTALAKKTGMKLSTVSGALTRLTAAGLVEHRPYGGIALTATGTRYALIMVRRHRLLETFLATQLGYRWDEVHEEADRLEHAVSDQLISRIADKLGHPDHDPHGDPIPTVEGKLPTEPGSDSLSLSQAPTETDLTVSRVSDESPDLLRQLSEQGIRVGTTLRIRRKSQRAEGSGIMVMTGGKVTQLVLDPEAAARIQVQVFPDQAVPTAQAHQSSQADTTSKE